MTERAYTAQLTLARAFLDGTSDGPLDELTQRMQSHSDALEFERAAQMRDKLQRLELLRIQLEKLRFAVETLTFAYPVTGHGNEARVYLIRRGTVRADLKQPVTRREQLEFAGLERLLARQVGADGPGHLDVTLENGPLPIAPRPRAGDRRA